MFLGLKVGFDVTKLPRVVVFDTKIVDKEKRNSIKNGQNNKTLRSIFPEWKKTWRKANKLGGKGCNHKAEENRKHGRTIFTQPMHENDFTFPHQFVKLERKSTANNISHLSNPLYALAFWAPFAALIKDWRFPSFKNEEPLILYFTGYRST